MKMQHSSAIYFAKIQSIFLFSSLIALAFMIRLELAPVLADRAPLALFILNSLILTQLFGLLAGFSSPLIGAVLSYYFFVPPYSSFLLPDAFHLIYFCVKFVVGSMLILLVIWINSQLFEIHEHH